MASGWGGGDVAAESFLPEGSQHRLRRKMGDWVVEFLHSVLVQQ